MSRVPSKEEILNWISDNPAQTSKRDIARAFGVKGADRVPLKAVLRELESEGHLEKRGKTYRDPERLPPVGVLEVAAPDAAGDLWLRPLEWQGEGPEPAVLYIPREGEPALACGDRVLARLAPTGRKGPGEPAYEARLIRKIAGAPRRSLGIFRKEAEGGRVVPVDKKADREWRVTPGATQGARDGELVEVEASGRGGRMGLPVGRVVSRLGDPHAPKAVSLIAIHEYGIPDAFPDAVLAEAEKMKPAGLKGRTDLRDLPFVTIDPADARDHDDAVYAHPDDDKANPGGHVVWVAIADVAHYVRPGSELDREARRRGNSTYFPDRVVPMLPERLSGDLCSLHAGVPRPCIAVRMQLDAKGNRVGHRFERAIMLSAASLTYEQVQAVADGAGDGRAAELAGDVVAPLYAAFEAARQARAKRQPLELDLPERRIELSEDGRVTSVAFKERLEAHRLIEEFMILANVCAAETLDHARSPLLYRVHEEPAPEKLDALRETAEAAGLALARGQVLQTRHLNRLLEQAQGTDDAELINMATLRAMTQAYYAPENHAHFGLALRQYAHFTSPIRRYADLIVHRALIAAHGWGTDGLSDWDVENLAATAKLISESERRSMAAERDTNDRYLAAYLAERVGEEMTGRIAGVARFGLFVKLDGTGADGLVPIRSIGAEFFHHDPQAQTLMGAESGRTLALGQRVSVRLAEAAPITGGLALELLEVEGEPVARGPTRGRRGAGPGRKPAAAKAKPGKAKAKPAKARHGEAKAKDDAPKAKRKVTRSPRKASRTG